MKYPLKIVPHNCQPFNGKPCSSVSIEGIDSLFQHPMDREEAEEIVKTMNEYHASKAKTCLPTCRLRAVSRRPILIHAAGCPVGRSL